MDPKAVQVLRLVLLLPMACLLYCAQRHWSRQVWRLTRRVRLPGLRRMLRGAWLAAMVVLVVPGILWFVTGAPRPLPQTLPFAASGLWLSSALFAWLGVKCVAAVEWLWNRIRRRAAQPAASPSAGSVARPGAPANPSRRYFFQTASYLAGGVPFVGAFYGFVVERLHYRVEHVEIPIPHLPAALDGLRIVQLSDIHIGGYIPAGQVRRAVDMANELNAHLAVVTGDFITGRRDPLEECVNEIARLRAPLGVWGCNGNHEIYAACEGEAATLFRRAGMRILRQQNAPLQWQGQEFNLIGVDYQISRGLDGRARRMLQGIESLVRRDVPNILLSHNPNAFVRAAEAGIELTLAGHTHGGQIQVEILHERLNPARFMTPFVAGLFQRQMQQRLAHLYVNRGLGTIGTPVRLNAPPEITVLTLRRA